MSTARNASSIVCAFVGLALAMPGIAQAADGSWRVGKSSGAVWVTKSQAQAISLTSDAVLREGDNITTGPNGRVLLIRGEERIMVSPNSAIGIPSQNASGMQTTITQRAGSILLDVEKKNVRHFEVETPYLAAVVKGTQFRVTVDGRGAKVDVTRGQVQVADFKSGQMALVLPGQAARVSSRGSAGLSLTGKGRLNPIERGTPRTAPSVQALAVPKAGLTRLSAGDKGKDASSARSSTKSNAAGGAFAQQISGPSKNALRIKAPIGEMKVDFHKVTNGLAHDASNSRTPGGDKKGSIFSESQNKGIGQVDATGKSTGNGNGGASSSVAASSGGGSNSAASGNASSGGNGNGVAGANSNAGGNGNGNAYGKNKNK